jgi:hypothetical protein
MAICGIPSMGEWENVFDSPLGFLVSFNYIGYSEEHRQVHGIYISHIEMEQEYFDQFDFN